MLAIAAVKKRLISDCAGRSRFLSIDLRIQSPETGKRYFFQAFAGGRYRS
jgi:hypothetical protein